MTAIFNHFLLSKSLILLETLDKRFSSSNCSVSNSSSPIPSSSVRCRTVVYRGQNYKRTRKNKLRNSCSHIHINCSTNQHRASTRLDSTHPAMVERLEIGKNRKVFLGSFGVRPQSFTLGFHGGNFSSSEYNLDIKMALFQ